MNILVLGTGYVGLVTGTCLAQLGHHVTCVDQDKAKVVSLEKGVCTIFEKDLEEFLAAGIAQGNLAFSSELVGSVENAEVIFICVGTPIAADGISPEMNYVDDACRSLAPFLIHNPVVVVKSTVPVGTSDRAYDIILKANPAAKFEIASNPEFLREGQAVADFMMPDRVVIGVASKSAEEKLRAVYRAHIEQGTDLVVTTPRSSELIKYTANCYLAMRLTFFNQIADLCEKAGANFDQVAEGCGLDKRIGDHYLSPGPGYGGSCFPKDTQALAMTARKLGSPLSLVETTIAANDARKAGLTKRIEKAVGGSLSGLNVTVLGLAFKADTDDMRDSVALELIPQLQKQGAKVTTFDPVCNTMAVNIFSGVAFSESAETAVHQADVVVVVTEWREFSQLVPKHLASVMRGKTVVDFRNLFDAKAMSIAGLRYFPLGAPMIEPSSLEADVNAA